MISYDHILGFGFEVDLIVLQGFAHKPTPLY